MSDWFEKLGVGCVGLVAGTIVGSAVLVQPAISLQLGPPALAPYGAGALLWLIVRLRIAGPIGMGLAIGYFAQYLVNTLVLS